MNEEQITQLIFQVLGTLLKSDRFTFEKLVQFLDGRNIQTGLATGTKIGTATSQKIGFWNATPVIQHASTGETTGFTAGSGTGAKVDSTFTGNVGSTTYTISDIVKALKNAGIMAQ